MGNVTNMRRTVLPHELFDIVEMYMHGELEALNVLALHKKKGLIQYSAGFVPESMSANDSTFDDLRRF